MSNRHFSCLQSWECESSWRIESSWISSAVWPFWFSFKRWEPLKLVQETPCQFREINKRGRLRQGMSTQSRKADLLKIFVQIAKTLHGGQCRVVSDDLCTFILTFVIFHACRFVPSCLFEMWPFWCMFAKKHSSGRWTSAKLHPAPWPWISHHQRVAVLLLQPRDLEFWLIMTDACPLVSRWFSTKQQALIAAL